MRFFRTASGLAVALAWLLLPAPSAHATTFTTGEFVLGPKLHESLPGPERRLLRNSITSGIGGRADP